MRFGYVVPNNFGVADPVQLVELAVEAEALGFGSVWVNHHVLNVGYVRDRLEDAPYHDALITLSWIGAATSRVRLGTSVLVMPYLHPMVLAKELATLDGLTRGRLSVGLGVGSLPEENALLGVIYEGRGRYSNEFIEVLKLLWTEPRASFQGEFFAFDDLISSPKPLQDPHPPILVGGNRPPALRRAGGLGDGWHGLNLRPDSVRKRLPAIQEAAAAADRAPLQEIQVRLDMSQVTPGSVAEYADAGVTELVMSINSGDVGENHEALRRFAAAHL
jgi:probable F420-dependent oxidoreductase